MDSTSGHLGSSREGEGGREGWDGTDLRPGRRAEALIAQGRLGSSQRKAWHSTKRKKTIFVTYQ